MRRTPSRPKSISASLEKLKTLSRHSECWALATDKLVAACAVGVRGVGFQHVLYNSLCEVLILLALPSLYVVPGSLRIRGSLRTPIGHSQKARPSKVKDCRKPHAGLFHFLALPGQGRYAA